MVIGGRPERDADATGNAQRGPHRARHVNEGPSAGWTKAAVKWPRCRGHSARPCKGLDRRERQADTDDGDGAGRDHAVDHGAHPLAFDSRTTVRLAHHTGALGQRTISSVANDGPGRQGARLGIPGVGSRRRLRTSRSISRQVSHST